MKRAIWKYPISPGETKILMPPADILAVGVQDGQVVMWAAVMPDSPPEEHEIRTFRAIMTGPEFSEADYVNLEHIGTVQVGPIVAHVFEDVS